MNKFPKENKVVIALSGGGIKCVAHIGLLAALRDHNIEVAAISGTSAGALVGAMHASGLSIQEMLTFFNSYSIFQPFNFTFTKPGLFDSIRYKGILESVLSPSFEELKIPLYVCISNLIEGNAEYVSKGELVMPVLASCAIPILFSPVKIGDNIYTDGGVCDNFPIDPLLMYENLPMWGSYVLKPFKTEAAEVKSSMKIILRSNHMLMYEANRHKFSATQYNFMPNMNKVNAYNSKHVDLAFNIGYANAKNELEKLFVKTES